LARNKGGEYELSATGILSCAVNYEITISPDQRLSERIIFPHSPSQINGIERCPLCTVL